MVTVAHCSNPAEAMLLKSVLEANGIPAFVPEELTSQSSPTFGGSDLRLQVAEEHEVTARQLLLEAEGAEEDDK